MNKLKKWLIFGIIFIIGVGSLSHFVYEWSGYNKIVGIFVLVNESVWEHIKGAIFPSLILMIIQYKYLRDNNNFIVASFLSILTIILLIPLIFYGYQLFVGNMLILDILDFIISVILGQFVFYKVMKYEYLSKSVRILSIIGLTIIIISYLLFTYYPPKIFLFEDPVTFSYGINK